MGVLWLVPARTMRATAAECFLPVTSHAIGKHLRDRGVCAGVAPEFIAKRNSELVGIRDGAPTTPSVPSWRFARQLSDAALSPASVSARASLPRPADKLFSLRAVRESTRLLMKRAASAGKCAVAWVEY
jgi:hypothetical protein